MFKTFLMYLMCIRDIDFQSLTLQIENIYRCFKFYPNIETKYRDLHSMIWWTQYSEFFRFHPRLSLSYVYFFLKHERRLNFFLKSFFCNYINNLIPINLKLFNFFNYESALELVHKKSLMNVEMVPFNTFIKYDNHLFN